MHTEATHDIIYEEAPTKIRTQLVRVPKVFWVEHTNTSLISSTLISERRV